MQNATAAKPKPSVHYIEQTLTRGAGETRVLFCRCSCGWSAQAPRVIELENEILLHRLQSERRA